MPTAQSSARSSQPKPAGKKPLLVFVEPYTDPSKDSKRRENQELVKRWSMLNRNVSFTAPNPAAPQHTSNIDEPAHDVPHPAQGGIKGRLVPAKFNQPRRPRHMKPKQKHQFEMACGLAPLLCKKNPGKSVDPFSILPVQLDGQSSGLLECYFNHHTDPVKSGFRADGAHADRLHDARRYIWAPLALASKSSCQSLIAFAAAAQASKSPSEFTSIQLERHLGEALRVTNQDLQDPHMSSSNEVFLSVSLLLLIARGMGDDRAFQAHSKGIELLLQFRRGPGHMTPFTPLGPVPAALTDLDLGCSRIQEPFTGNGFVDAYQGGFISEHSWRAHWSVALILSRLVLETGADVLWYCAVQQHMWLLREPAEEGLDPVDRLLRATLRLTWHLVVFKGFVKTSPVIAATTKAIQESFNAIDWEVAGSALDYAVLWAALVGSCCQKSPKYFRALLKFALRRLGELSYEKALSEIEARYLWHPSLDNVALNTWDMSRKHSLPSQKTLLATLKDQKTGNCCRTENADYDKVCLCAWWT